VIDTQAVARCVAVGEQTAPQHAVGREADSRNDVRRSEGSLLDRWTMYVQIMEEQDADTYHIHPFDLTKVWPTAR
jgi:catalase